VIFSLQAQARVAASLGWAGFFGRISLGALYETENRHSFEFSMGAYSGGSGDKYQSNLGYHYSVWKITRPNFSWEPMQLGIFAMYSWDKKFFLKSPGKYPLPDYYDETAFRWGLEQGMSLQWMKEKWALVLVMRLIDSGIIAIYNNSHRDLQYYLSSGLRLEYRF
jgi:hypothetical protein